MGLLLYGIDGGTSIVPRVHASMVQTIDKEHEPNVKYDN